MGRGEFGYWGGGGGKETEKTDFGRGEHSGIVLDSREGRTEGKIRFLPSKLKGKIMGKHVCP